ncbi:MAG TPA: hypothetical protein VGB92_26835 [Longimicrobium sp.]|jgi:hypothetical protein
MGEMDLEPIMVKAMEPEEGYGWTLDFTQAVAQEYKKYLVLCLENPDFPVVPSNYVDDFWHLHILDTLKYQEDCEEYLGYFLHHFPYFGMRGEQDAENLTKAWNQTRELYTRRFGTIPEVYWPVSNRCPNCGRRCRSQSADVFMDERPRLSGLALAH